MISTVDNPDLTWWLNNQNLHDDWLRTGESYNWSIVMITKKQQIINKDPNT